MNELMLDLIHPFLNFKAFVKIRCSAKSLFDITEQRDKCHYWEYINFTDKSFSTDLLDEAFPNSYIHIWNRDKKNKPVYSLPRTLMSKVHAIKVIMI